MVGSRSLALATGATGDAAAVTPVALPESVSSAAAGVIEWWLILGLRLDRELEFELDALLLAASTSDTCSTPGDGVIAERLISTAAPTDVPVGSFESSELYLVSSFDGRFMFPVASLSF